jgi:hypothetical protein
MPKAMRAAVVRECGDDRCGRIRLRKLEHINRAARWNYQRDRVFVRSGISKKKTKKKAVSRKPIKNPQKVVALGAPTFWM